MSMVAMNADSLSRTLGVTVPDMYVVIAKNSVLDMSRETIGELLGASMEEILAVEADPIYQNCRLLLASEYSKGIVEADLNWDHLEQMALNNLSKRMQYENDSEFNLKVAAIANKAQRRMSQNNGNRALDPSLGGTRVPITLTSRIVKKLNQRTGEQEIEETRQISISDGTAKNPSFEDIDEMLGVSVKPKIPVRMGIATHEPDFSVEDLYESTKQRNF